ncbi:MAG TPA: hypothetical protein VJ866_18080 [Pyrinomonadaceae bacterium]|nr:hypothetical protein [Pyrinomonadaceae bacterium]
MKSGSCAAFGLLLLACALPLAANAGKGGPSAEGSVRLSAGSLSDGIDFSAEADEDGNATGRMTFTEAPKAAAVRDANGRRDPDGARPVISFSADFDCLSVVSNRAVMSGVVTQSTPEGYAGRRVVLAVVDNGDGAGQGRRDKLTWGVYRLNEQSWTASDAEEENDTGAGLTWTATDAEREDDAGEPSNRAEATTCKNIPLSSFSLIELKEGEGDIRVRP